MFNPLLFDRFLKYYFKIAYKRNRHLLFDFHSIYSFFQIFGLRYILPKTFQRISAAMQWNVCHARWIDKAFLENYLKSHLPVFQEEAIQSVNQLQMTMDIIQNEEIRKEKFKKELIKDLAEL